MSLWLPRPPPASLLHTSRHGLASHRLLVQPRLISTLLNNSRNTHATRTHLDNESRQIIAGSYSSSRFASTDSDSSKPSTTTSTTHSNTAIEDPEKSTTPKPSPPAPKSDPKEPLSTRVWSKVKHEAQHYWHGSKLLAKEVRISARLQWKLLHGESLTRRERRQVRLFYTHL